MQSGFTYTCWNNTIRVVYLCRMEEPINDRRPEWLKSMAEKTWNLELIISGAATYMASFLPELTDQALYYFLDNLNTHRDLTEKPLIILAYSFAKLVAWLLPLTFVVHFVLRAFWAGLVGLHTVYPEGIRFDHIPGVSGITKSIMEESYGALADFIQRIDQLCNRVFAFAFTIVLFSIGIGFIYLIVFGFTELAPLVLGAKWGKWAGSAIIFLLLALPAGQLAVYIFRNKIDKERHPKLYRLLVFFLVHLPAIYLPFIFRPVTYLNLTFSSNTGKRRYYGAMTGVMILVLCAFIFIFANTLLTLRQSNGFTVQRYFGRHQNQFTLVAEHYETAMNERSRPAAIILPAEVVEGPYLKLFISYPKYMDEALAEKCVVPTAPDSLPGSQRHLWRDSLRAQCFQQFIRLSVNDSLYKDQEWLFHRHPQYDRIGLTGFIPTAGFKPGKNLLRVKVPVAGGPSDSLVVYDEAPFWFHPN